MSKKKNEDIKDDIHSESETDELEESNEVVSVVKDEKHADNKIVEVMQKGWRLHERVIRPARVVVIKN
jgi:hypothetical protein